jgi:hypothetical protein
MTRILRTPLTDVGGRRDGDGLTNGSLCSCCNSPDSADGDCHEDYCRDYRKTLAICRYHNGYSDEHAKPNEDCEPGCAETFFYGKPLAMGRWWQSALFVASLEPALHTGFVLVVWVGHEVCASFHPVSVPRLKAALTRSPGHR